MQVNAPKNQRTVQAKGKTTNPNVSQRRKMQEKKDKSERRKQQRMNENARRNPI